jgi:hypothetical protein
MSFEAIINDQRAISRLTVAINSIVAQQVFDGSDPAVGRPLWPSL